MDNGVDNGVRWGAHHLWVIDSPHEILQFQSNQTKSTLLLLKDRGGYLYA